MRGLGWTRRTRMVTSAASARSVALNPKYRSLLQPMNYESPRVGLERPLTVHVWREGRRDSPGNLVPRTIGLAPRAAGRKGRRNRAQLAPAESVARQHQGAQDGFRDELHHVVEHADGDALLRRGPGDDAGGGAARLEQDDLAGGRRDRIDQVDE